MRQSLIFSRSANNGVLSNERIMQLAPAVFATDKADRLTDRYVSLNTASMMPVLADNGWLPTQAVQRFGRSGKAEHKHHFVAFSHASTLTESFNEDLRPEIILYNSHDGSSAVNLFAGAFRFICSNGIVAGDGFRSKVYHSKSLSGFEDMLRETIANVPRMMERIEVMRNVNLDRERQIDLARRAAQVRWDLAKEFAEDAKVRGTFAVPSTIIDLSYAHRFADNRNDAWTVFNRIQENVIRGNAFVKSFTDKSEFGTLRKARPINSASEAVRVNRELWNIADELVSAV